MKKILVLFLFVFPLFSLSALPEEALSRYLQKSLDHWDFSAPWVRMGKESYSDVLDPTEIILAIREDMASKNRLEEFKYIFDYYNHMLKEESLTIGIVEETPPTPGFFPVRHNGQSRGLVVSRQDFDMLARDPQLYRSSFLRALTILVYLDNNARFHTHYNQRNFLVEVLAFMTGYHVESIYLSEILGTWYPHGPFAGYYELLIRSARENNLREFAFIIFSLDLDFIYNVITNIRKMENIQTAGSLLDYYGEIPDMLLYDANRLSFMPEPNMAMINKGCFIRSVVMTMPWLYLDLRTRIPQSLIVLRDTLRESYESFSQVFYGFRYGDVPILENQIQAINQQKFRPADPAVVSIIERENALPKQEPDNIKWYRYYYEEGLFNPVMRLEVSAEVASRTAVYGLSRTDTMELNSVFYRVKGRAEIDYFLDGAATIQLRREQDRELWFWKNEYGAIVNNTRGVAVVVATRDPESAATVYRFYNREGYAIRDSSGAWKIKVEEPDPETRDILFLDAANNPLRTVYGYAFDRRNTISPEESERYFYDEEKNPVMSWNEDYHFSRLIEVEQEDSFTRTYHFYDTEKNPVSLPGQAVQERRFSGMEHGTVSIHDATGALMLSSAGFAVQHTEFENGQIRKAWFTAIDNKPAFTIDGFSSVVYEYDDIGRIKAFSFYDIYDNPVISSSGYHRKEYSFENGGLIRDIQHLDTEGNPAQDEQNVFRVRLYLDNNGIFQRAEAWDIRGNLINAPTGDSGGSPFVWRRTPDESMYL